MQSSFIDLGLERDGFLYVADVIDTLEEFEKLESGDDDEEGRRAARRPAAAGRRAAATSDAAAGRRSRTC